MKGSVYPSPRRLAIVGMVIGSLVFCGLPGEASAALMKHTRRLSLVLGGPAPGTERVAWDADITLVPPTDGILPDREDVTLKLSIQTPDVLTFYQVSVPAGGLATSDGTLYKLTDAARNSTGLEVFNLTRQADGSFAVALKDARATLQNLNYSEVFVDIQIGNDSSPPVDPGSRLQPSGNIWNGF